MGVILTGETIPGRPTTLEQEAAAAAYVRRIADAQGWAPGDVLDALGLGGAR